MNTVRSKRTLKSILFASLLLIFFFVPARALAATPISETVIEFNADRTEVKAGECVQLHWNTQNVKAVYFNGQGVSGIDQTRVECPTGSTAYYLEIIKQDDSRETRMVQINVLPGDGNSNSNNGYITFYPDRTQIRAGECVNIHWHTANVKAVYYNGQGVSGIDQNRIECPDRTTTYYLTVVKQDDRQETQAILINVSGSAAKSFTARDGQPIDLDKGKVSDSHEDIWWDWQDGEYGVIVKDSNDKDLRLAGIDRHHDKSFSQWSKDDCKNRLNKRDRNQLDLNERMTVCFETEEGRYGKFYVKDIRSSDGKLELEWLLWD